MIYKLQFATALHIGNDTGSATLASAEMTVHSDTLFSALCIEALQLGGEKLLHELYEKSKTGKIGFSDLFPYKKETYYLPRPILNIESNITERDPKKSKEYKNLKYIPSNRFADYLASLQGQAEFDVKAVNKDISSLGASEGRQCVSIKRETEPQPYYVGCFKFKPDAGLYFIVTYTDEEDIDFITRIMESLALSGIGGKRSAGLGKFILDDPIFLDAPYSEGLEALASLLNNDNSTQQMLLNLALPQDHELDQACSEGHYMLVRRGGFVQSDTYWHHQLKKKLLYAFAPGSCFKSAFQGDIYDVSNKANHKVYRYLKPMFMGVNI